MIKREYIQFCCIYEHIANAVSCNITYVLFEYTKRLVSEIIIPSLFMITTIVFMYGVSLGIT